MSDRFRTLWLRLFGPEPAPEPRPRVAMVAGGVLQAGLVRVTAVRRLHPRTGVLENYLGWRVQGDTDAEIAGRFCQRFLPSDHQGSRSAQ